MKITLLVLLSSIMLVGCSSPCDNECLRLKQEHAVKMEELRIEGLSKQAEIEANRPVAVQVAEVERKQAQEDVWVWEAVLWVWILWATILPFLLMD